MGFSSPVSGPVINRGWKDWGKGTIGMDQGRAKKEGRAEIIGEKSEIPCKADDVASTPIPVSCKGYSDMLQGSIDRVYQPIIFGVTDLF